MAKYKIALLFILGIILIAGLMFSEILGLPLKKPLPEQKLIYYNEKCIILVLGQKVFVKGKGLNARVFPLPENKFIGMTRIGKKPKGRLPIEGIALEDGLLLTGGKNVYVADLMPVPQIRLTYPNPRTKKNKIIVTKKSNMIYFYNRGYLVKKYQIATGKEHHYTPEGRFKIVIKAPYPKGKDPDSQLGPRWMGLEVPYHLDKRENKYNPGKIDPRAPQGLKYGIHGTNKPGSIGTHASGGCIRLRNEDIIELYTLVPLGTEVEITD